MNIAEIARKADVSTATVSRTLNQSGPVKAATARKVWRAVTALNYYPTATRVRWYPDAAASKGTSTRSPPSSSSGNRPQRSEAGREVEWLCRDALRD